MPLVITLYALFATVFIICKNGLEYSQPLFLVGSRMTVAGCLILCYLLWRQRDQLIDLKGQKWRLCALAFFNIYLTNACEIWGLQYLSSAKTCFIYSLSPFFAALLSFFLFGEGISNRKWVGLAIGFVGLMPIILYKSSTEELTGSFWVFSWAELAVCIASFSSVYGWILLRQVVNDAGLSFLTANGISMLIGGGMALIHSFIIEEWHPFPVSQYGPFLLCSGLLLLISNFICYNLYGFLLKKYTATFISFAGFMTPLFTAAMGWFYFGDEITLPFIIAAVVVFTGLYLFYYEELKSGYRVLPQTA